ncbi:MAG: hypothetical protein JXR45_22805 [Deltaproteobacteria bacterium]|nr:hypothetical protein [Deltaproteobacteria bacterium]
MSNSEKLSIVVLGTSNSIAKDNWLSGFRSVLPAGSIVHNYSLGANCAGVHVANVLLHESDIQHADLVIVDAAINGLSHVEMGLLSQETEIEFLRALYSILGELKKPVISMILPILDRAKNKIYKNRIYKKHLALLNGFGFITVNMYPLLPDIEYLPQIFRDNNHLLSTLMYRLGCRLGELVQIYGDKLHPGAQRARSSKYDYNIVSAEKIAERFNLPLAVEKNSAVSLPYIELNQSIVFNEYSNFELVGILHWHPHSLSRLKVRTSKQQIIKACRGKFAGFESFLHPIHITDSICFNAATESEAVDQPTIENRYPYLSFGRPRICAILLRTPRKTKISPTEKLKLILPKKGEQKNIFEESVKEIFAQEFRLFAAETAKEAQRIDKLIHIGKTNAESCYQLAIYYQLSQPTLAKLLIDLAVSASPGNTRYDKQQRKCNRIYKKYIKSR